jgi:hypothetical protein
MQRENKIKEIPVKARFSAPVQTGPGAHPASQLPIQWIPGVFAGGKTAGAWRGVDHYHHLEPRLRKKYKYTYTSPLGLHGRFQGELRLLSLPSAYEGTTILRNVDDALPVDTV